MIAGIVFHDELPLAVWFLAIYLISQHKTGLVGAGVGRNLGVRSRGEIRGEI